MLSFEKKLQLTLDKLDFDKIKFFFNHSTSEENCFSKELKK